MITDYDEYEDLDGDEWCNTCQGEGRVPTEDHESYLGAMYKPCPVCHGDDCTYEPKLS